MFESLLARVHGKLGRWSSRFLSKTGRCILIRSVSSAISAYTMQVVKISFVMLELMGKAQRQLFWDEMQGSSYLHALC